MAVFTYDHINLDYMDLMADGDMEMKKTMVEMLLDELPSEIDKIISLVEAKDYKTIKAVSHKLKSTLAFVGNEGLNQTNKALESIAIEEGSWNELDKLSKQMKEYCDLILIELRTEFGKL